MKKLTTEWVSLQLVYRYTDLSESADGDSAGKYRPGPSGDYHADDTSSSHGSTVRIAHRHKPMHGDVHERVDGRYNEQRRHEAGGQAQSRVKHPLGTYSRRQWERHCQQTAQQVGHCQTAQEQIGASAHAPVTYDNDDDERVADDGDDHDG